MADDLDLVLAPGPGVVKGLVVPASVLQEQFAKATGPGGQGVNTTDSRVQLTVDVSAIPGLTDRQRERLLTGLAARLDGTSITVDAAEERSQLRNRKAARARLAALLREALAPPPPPRRATRPTRGSVQRRLEAKKQHAEVKRLRRRPDA